MRPSDPDRLLEAPEVHAWNRQDDYMPYWAYLWPGAYFLGEALAREEVRPGEPALEIGCGLGLAGLLAVARGWHVTFTDYDESGAGVRASQPRRRTGSTRRGTRPGDSTGATHPASSSR